MALRRKAILETPNRKRRKRRRIIQRVIFLVVIVVLFVWGIVSLLRIDALQVTDVSVVGAREVDPTVLHAEAAAEAAGEQYPFIPKSFFLFYPRQTIIASILASHSEIDSVKMRRRGFKGMEITISERTPRAVYCLSSCFYVDIDGLVYRTASSSDGYVRFRDLRPEYQDASPIGRTLLDKETFKDIVEFSGKLGSVGMHLLEVQIQPGGDLRIDTREGMLVISAKEPIPAQFEFLKTALSQPMFKNADGSVHSFDYIDLRFGKKIFYRLPLCNDPYCI